MGQDAGSLYIIVLRLLGEVEETVVVTKKKKNDNGQRGLWEQGCIVDRLGKAMCERSSYCKSRDKSRCGEMPDAVGRVVWFWSCLPPFLLFPLAGLR